MTPPRRWSTDAVAPAQRLDYWVGAVCEGFLEMDVSTGTPRTFDAELVSMPLGSVVVNQVRGSTQEVFRRPTAIARSTRDYYYLLWKAGTPGHVEQGGRGARLCPGDLTLIDSRQGYALRFPQTVDVLSLQLPIGWLQTWVPSPHQLLAKPVDGSRGWGQVLSTFVQQLQPGLNPTARCAEQVLSDQLGQLLSLALDEEAPARTIDAHSTALLQRLDDWLQAEGHHPGVHAAQAALALGVSVRSLYRGLSAHHTTFADRLLQHRLAAAQRMLGSPAFDGLTLAEIGRRVGWPDPSHFTRVCRRALGRTPQQLRWQHRPADSTPSPGKA